jgi:hypothetical protein
MDPHFCSTCGVACNGPAEVVEGVSDGDDGDTVERALDTVDHALDVIDHMHEDEETTEQVEAIADAEVDIVEAEADATVDVVEALTEEEPVTEEEHVDEPVDEPAEDEVDEPVDEPAEEPAEEEGETTSDKGTPVEVPPQLEENDERPSGGARTTSAFRRRRMRGRR